MIKVLVADDEEIVRTSLVDMIPWQELGMVLVGSVRNGVEALDIVSDDPPDIVITDIRMPMMDGLELIERIKVLSPDTEIIILSGFSEFSYAQKAMSYGVKHYLLKPTRKEDLIELLRRISYERTDNGALRYSYQLERLMLLDALSDPSTIGHSLKLLGINPASGAAIQEGRGGVEPFFRPVMAGGTVYSFVPDGAPDAPRLEDAIASFIRHEGLDTQYEAQYDEMSTYPETKCLVNYFNIRDRARLRQVEHYMVNVRTAELFLHPLKGMPTFSYLRDVHSHLFGDIFPSAGMLRTAEASKRKDFCRPQYIERFSQEIFSRLSREDYLRNIADVDDFVNDLAFYMGEAEALHPFRDGNGRAIRFFFNRLVEEAGYTIRWCDADPDRMLEASIAAIDGDYQALIAELGEMIEPRA